jgi:DNA-binding SARP family transcriptional activator
MEGESVATTSLVLIGGFEVRHGGEELVIPLSVQRLVAFVALHERPLPRVFVAGTLWLDLPEERASANLRCTLWRLRTSGLPLVQTRSKHLRLAPEVTVDVREMVVRARELTKDEAWTNLAQIDTDLFQGELLPGWYEDWVELERERLRQLSTHAMERLCMRLTVAGQYSRAIEAGLLAVAAEPLRESSHRALIEAHLAEGNRSEAIRHYQLYRQLLDQHLGLPPSPTMDLLFQDFASDLR